MDALAINTIRGDWQRIETEQELFFSLIQKRLSCNRIFQALNWNIHHARQSGQIRKGLEIVLHSLDQPGIRAPLLGQLGGLLKKAGVRQWHISAAGRILLWALRIMLGGSFNHCSRHAWISLLAVACRELRGRPAHAGHACWPECQHGRVSQNLTYELNHRTYSF